VFLQEFSNLYVIGAPNYSSLDLVSIQQFVINQNLGVKL